MNATSIALSGLQAASMGFGVTANNVANVNSVDYKAQRLDLEEQQEGGVRASALKESQEPTEQGGSNVDLATEFTNSMLQASTYQANLKVMEAQKQVLGMTLDLKA